MKKKRFLCLLLVLGLLLSGCSLDSLRELADELAASSVTPYSEMEYIRPDMDALEQILEESCAILAETGSGEKAINAIDAFYREYDRFYTSYYLADIRYSGNLRDTGWEAEYNYCAENAAAVDAALDELYRAAAVSDAREALERDYFGEGFFESYEGESLWDETFLALTEEEARLQSAYYALSDQALESAYYSEEYFTLYGTQMAELFVELIALRQQIAEYAGYESYPQFAYDFYYYRDYTPEASEAYLERIGELFYERYCQMEDSSVWEILQHFCTETDTFSYVKQAAKAMGGIPAEAFTVLERAGVYDISYGENKYASSFELYLWSYGVPFIFMDPWMNASDKLTFAHEFGHFCNDYICGGSYAGTDVAEVHSQAFEYLSLCYGQPPEGLRDYKLAESLELYVEQSAYALFETRVYGLTGEELTVENVQALYEDIGRRFGLDSRDWDPRDFVTVPHFYTNPMYIVSYVVSNDLAMQIYEMELAEPGAGLALYEELLYSQESFLIAFAESYGLKDPMSPKRLGELDAFFQNSLTPQKNAPQEILRRSDCQKTVSLRASAHTGVAIRSPKCCVFSDNCDKTASFGCGFFAALRL